MKKLSRLPIEDLTELFANAIQDAVWKQYTTSHSVYGMEADGKIYRYFPDGDAVLVEEEDVKTIGTGDTEIDKDDAVELREDMIELRDEALAQGDMHWSVLLSHVVAFMANAIEEIWPSPATIVENMVTAREASHPIAYLNKVEFDEPLAQAALEKMRKDLAWKGPTGRTQAVVALPREMAEALIKAMGASHVG